MNNLSANEQRLAEFERAVDPNDPQQQELLQQMRTELAKVRCCVCVGAAAAVRCSHPTLLCTLCRLAAPHCC